eukprot:Protomagalhaensia_wolfi_Nauph_80__3011@NODE_3088_length_895_cov_1_913551_g2418_i0_p2_GENE_NODE_3088_length_895_cov_1_913551_g2418_i0NODE_3088_length_895_cov_1_913551_g2418_i0_p2_ORF_typecomplete_len124_score29_15_NODE_3088_length_895_cov_1_913551_g2418_i023394
MTDPDSDKIQFDDSIQSLVGSVFDWENVIVPQQFSCDCTHPCYQVVGNVHMNEDCEDLNPECVDQCGSQQRDQMVPKTSSTSTVPLQRMDSDTWETLIKEEQEKAKSESNRINMGHIYPVDRD